MRSYYYYQSLRKTIVQFLDVFKNVKIERKDADGNTSGYKRVPLKFGTKEKVWYWLNEKKDEEILPIMSVVMSSMDYDSSRQGNRTHEIMKSRSFETYQMDKFVNPIPYNVGFTMTIWSLHVIDIDQILEQILPWFNPAAFVRINIPELDANFDLKILFNGCTPDVTHEFGDEDVRIVKWTLDFKVQTYLLRPLETTGIIEKVIQKIYTESNAWNHRFTESVYTSGAGGFEAESVYTKSSSPYSDINDWEADTHYGIGDLILPTTKNGYLYIVDTMDLTGKSGSTEPTWSTEEYVPIIDNNLYWLRWEPDTAKRITQYYIFPGVL